MRMEGSINAKMLSAELQFRTVLLLFKKRSVKTERFMRWLMKFAG